MDVYDAYDKQTAAVVDAARKMLAITADDEEKADYERFVAAISRDSGYSTTVRLQAAGFRVLEAL